MVATSNKQVNITVLKVKDTHYSDHDLIAIQFLSIFYNKQLFHKQKSNKVYLLLSLYTVPHLIFFDCHHLSWSLALFTSRWKPRGCAWLSMVLGEKLEDAGVVIVISAILGVVSCSSDLNLKINTLLELFTSNLPRENCK